MSRPPVRSTARVLVLDPAGRVLLLGARLADLTSEPGEVLYWYTPGGGVEDGESLRAAAVRELAEEIGLVVEPAALEGPVWLRRVVGPVVGVEFDSRETFFVLRDVVHRVVPGELTELERRAAEPHRWFEPAELREVPVEPPGLEAALPELLAGPWSGPPRVLP